MVLPEKLRKIIKADDYQKYENNPMKQKSNAVIPQYSAVTFNVAYHTILQIYNFTYIMHVLFTQLSHI